MTSGLRRLHLRLVTVVAVGATIEFLLGLASHRPEPVNGPPPAGLHVDPSR